MKFKKIMTFMVIAFVATFVLTSVSFAQEQKKDTKQCNCKEGSHGKHGKKGMRGDNFGPGRMFKDLDLTPEQEKKANEIFKSSREKADKVVTESQKKQMKDIRENSMKEFRAILTPEQAKKLDEKQKLMEQRRENRGNKKANSEVKK